MGFLVSLPSSPSDTVVRMLFNAIDTGIERRSFDEDLITSVFLALNKLKSLSILGTGEAASIIQRITDDRFVPVTRHCHSAYCCTLATLHDPSFDLGPKLLNKMISEITATVAYWMDKKYKGGVVFEAMWALNKILET